MSLLLVVFLLLPVVAFSDAQSSSSHYQVSEVFFGAGGELEACKTGGTYCAKESAGDLGVGKTCGTAFCAHGGFNSDRTPYLEMTVNNTSVNLGTVSATGTKWATASFSVKAYLAHGYSVVNASPPPTNGSYTIHTNSSPTVSSPGTEQFGINLVKNNSPTTNLGANPGQLPDSSFAFGQAGTETGAGAEYGTADHYMYSDQPGLNEVAYSTQSSSYTQFTITYIFNISHVTPGGTYTMQHVLVATGTY